MKIKCKNNTSVYGMNQQKQIKFEIEMKELGNCLLISHFSWIMCTNRLVS